MELGMEAGAGIASLRCWNMPDTGVSAPTLSRLGDRAHLVSRSINLPTHIDDIVSHVRSADHQDITLVGHSYGGFPATAAAHRLGPLDAFLPMDGEMLLDHVPAMIAQYRKAAEADEGWNIPPIPSAGFGVAETDQPWVDARLTPYPVKSYFERVLLPGLDAGRKTYIRCTQAPGDLLAPSIQQARSDLEWRYREFAAPHDAMINHPDLLAQTLLSDI
jgi:pimeloyl-ACP methyl ester carboxylesterase